MNVDANGVTYTVVLEDAVTGKYIIIIIIIIIVIVVYYPVQAKHIRIDLIVV